MSLQNPYEDLYRTKVMAPVSGFTMKQAEQMATQMSLIYHAFGGALKDMVRLLSILYSTERPVEKIDGRFTREIIQEKDESSKSSVSQKRKDLDEQNQLKLVQKAVNQPDFSKYMIKLPQQPTKKRSVLSQKFMERESKSIKALNDQKTVERIEVVRGQKERKTLQGYSCTVCHDFYKALGQDYNDSSGRDKLCNDCSRHRSNLPPTNFHMDFSQQFGFQD